MFLKRLDHCGLCLNKLVLDFIFTLQTGNEFLVCFKFSFIVYTHFYGMQIILSTFPGAMTVLLMCVILRKHLEILVTMCFVLTESRHRRIGIRDSIPFIIYRLVSMQSGMKYKTVI